MNLNASPSPFHMEQLHDQSDLHPFGPSSLIDSSSSSVSCRILFNSTQDHTGYYQPLYQPMYHDQEDDNYACHGGSSYEIKNKVETSGLKLTLWKKDNDHDPRLVPQGNNQLQKMKNKPDRVTLKISSSATVNKLEDQNNSDLSSCSSSYNMNSPIRVCSDCNTTKTPLWRSGPKGPKSLCNACGIRQRKARRAAAAAANGAAVASNQPPTMKIKVQLKEKNIVAAKNGHGKRCKINAGAASSSTTTLNKRQKLGFEDFLINLNNKFAFHQVFPEEEKDAAILLMALSSGLVHG